MLNYDMDIEDIVVSAKVRYKSGLELTKDTHHLTQSHEPWVSILSIFKKVDSAQNTWYSVLTSASLHLKSMAT